MKQSDLGKSLDPNVQSAEKRLTQSARQRIIVEGDLSLVLGARSQTLCKKSYFTEEHNYHIVNANVFSPRKCEYANSLCFCRKAPTKFCGLETKITTEVSNEKY